VTKKTLLLPVENNTVHQHPIQRQRHHEILSGCQWPSN
jgi:hypothetical protein